jgi:hypothetical protein
MSWTRILRAKEIVNNRLVMVRTKQACYYCFIIFDGIEEDFRTVKKESGYDYTSWKAAMSAGKKEAKTYA